MLYTPFSKYISSHLDTNESTSYSTVSRWRGRSLDPGAADTEDVIEAVEDASDSASRRIWRPQSKLTPDAHVVTGDKQKRTYTQDEDAEDVAEAVEDTEQLEADFPTNLGADRRTKLTPRRHVVRGRGGAT